MLAVPGKLSQISTRIPIETPLDEAKRHLAALAQARSELSDFKSVE